MGVDKVAQLTEEKGGTSAHRGAIERQLSRRRQTADLESNLVCSIVWIDHLDIGRGEGQGTTPLNPCGKWIAPGVLFTGYSKNRDIVDR